MDGLLSGLSALGLDDLEQMDIFEDTKKKQEETVEKVPEIMEKDLIYDKTYTCPVCDKNFTAKIMKTGKAKLLGTDRDLRPRYEGIDAQKYDVLLCSTCGYAALARFFPHLTPTQVKLIKEQISRKVHLHAYEGEIYTYEEALEHYKLALASAVVKRAKNSEKAYICLKTAWLLRGYEEFLRENPDKGGEKLEAVRIMARTHIQNAYKGFSEALKTEGFPMCGMDEVTINYLLAVLAMEADDYDTASKMVARILTDPSVNSRIKDKARDLKEEILVGLKKK